MTATDTTTNDLVAALRSEETGQPVSVFSDYEDRVYRNRFAGTIVVETLVGGTPSDPKVAEGWLKTKLGIDKDDLIRSMVATTLAERGVEKSDDEIENLIKEAAAVSGATEEEVDKAVQDVVAMKHLNGFKRDEKGLYIEGRQLKACLKEASNIAWPKDRWGPSNKGTKSYFAEHVFVVENRLHLGVFAATGVNQRFVHTFRGTGIQYEEYVDDATFDFTVITDHDIKPATWGEMWVTAQQNGLGAARSQGFGRFKVTRWEQLPN